MEVEWSRKSAPGMGTSPCILLIFLCTLSYHPPYKAHSQIVKPCTAERQKDEQFKVDNQFPFFCLLDGIYRLNMVLPAGKASPFLDRAGFKELYDWTSPV